MRLLFLLLPIILLSNPIDLANALSNPVHLSDKKQAKTIIKTFLKQNKNIIAIKIINNSNNSIFLKAYKNKGYIVFGKLPQSSNKELIDIKHNNKVIAKLILFKSTKSFLTPKEINWIKNNTITIGVEQWKPIIFSNNGEDIDGICGDFTKLIIQKTGLKVRFVNNKWGVLLDKFKHNKIDILPDTYYTPQRASYGFFSKAYFKIKNYLYVKSNNNTIHSFEDLKNKKLAIIKGYGTIDEIRKKFPSIQIVETNNLDDSIQRLLGGKVDALYDGEAVVEYKIKNSFINGLKAIPQNTFPAKKLHYFVHNKTLLSIIQKTLNHITLQERNKIFSKWLHNTSVYLTNDERKWINTHTINYVIVQNWKPIEWVDELQEPQGVLPDILKIITQKTGLRFNFIYYSNFDKALNKLEHDQADALSVGLNNLKYLNYTNPIIKTPYVFVSKNTKNFPNGLKDLKNQKVGVFANSSLYHTLKQLKLSQLIKLTNPKQAFEMLKNNDLDVFVCNGITAKYYTHKPKYKKILKISYKTNFYFTLRIGINKKLGKTPIKIINKAISKINQKDKDDIVDKWIMLHIKKTIHWKLIIEIGAIVFGIILFMWWNNRKLNNLVKEKTKDLQARTKELEILSNSLEIKVQEKTKELESEKKLINSIINSQNDIVVTSNGNKIITINNAFKQFFELGSIEEFEKKYGHCICDSFENVDGYLQKYKDGIFWIEYIKKNPHLPHKVVIKKRDIPHIFSVSLDSFIFEGKKFITVVLNDITQLEEQKNHLKKFFENRGVGILIVDANRNIKEINDKFCEIWKYQPQEILGKPAEILHISYESYKTFGAKAFERITKNKPIQIEYQMKRKNGEIFWAKFSGETLSDDGSVLWIISDITELKNAKEKIEAMHKHTRESIEFASLIQNALIPRIDKFKIFKDKFILWSPKDIVGGDIYLFETLRNEDECLLMCIDCTGHGVPGAFVTMIVKAVEREIVSKIKDNQNLDVSPSWVLEYFNKTIKKLLKQESIDSISNAGFDGGIVYYNKRTQILKFAGANSYLFYIQNGTLYTIKADRYSVGYKKSDPNHQFKEYIIEVEENMKFYISTDGYYDQNGGEKGFPFGRKRFEKIIKEIHEYPMQKQKETFIQRLLEYQKNSERNDDITLIGFVIDKKSDNKDIFRYEGVITQNVIATAMDNIENKVPAHISPKLATITIEYCQNMMNYSKNSIEQSDTIVPTGFICVEYLGTGDYKITAKNIISLEDKKILKQRLDEILLMDQDQLKKRYRQLRKSGENSHNQGGGIGLYEIAKISSNIKYNFVPINKNKFYFIITSMLTFGNKNKHNYNKEI